MHALIFLFYAVLCAPGLLVWWWLHRAVEPYLIHTIPAPRQWVPDLDINPPHNDWRGFT